MGGLPIPKLKRCCGCTRNLKVACILIAILCMLSTSHSIRIALCPLCKDLEDGEYYHDIIIINWVLYAVNLLTLISSFGYLLGLFIKGYRYTADIFMAFGFISIIIMCVHGVYNILKMIADNHCHNPSDSIAHFIYAILWIYFILIVNSHRDNM